LLFQHTCKTVDQALKEILCEVFHQSYIWWLSAPMCSLQIWCYSQPAQKNYRKYLEK
jgi:hypothetical protein